MKLSRLIRGKQKQEVKLEATEEAKPVKKDGIIILDENQERCESACSNLKKALKIMDADLAIDIISDPLEIMELGITEQPAFIVRGKVIAKGKVLSTTDLIQLLHNYV